MTEKNSNRVPKKSWRRWTETARRVFNETYVYVYENPTIVLATNATMPPSYHWKVLAWNVAWIAADAADDELHLAPRAPRS